MKVTIKLYATLRKHSSNKEGVVDCNVPEGTRISDLLKLLSIEPARQPVFVLNGHHASPEAELSSGDTLIIYPSVAGG